MSISPFLRDLWDINPSSEFVFFDWDLPSSRTAPRTRQQQQRLSNQPQTFRPPVDILEERSNLVYMVELPGIQKQDVNLTFTRNGLEVSGKKEMACESGNWLKKEIQEGEFRRTIPLPKGVEPKNIRANFECGVLTVRVPKIEEREEKAFEIPIKESKTTKRKEVTPVREEQEGTKLGKRERTEEQVPESSLGRQQGTVPNKESKKTKRKEGTPVREEQEGTKLGKHERTEEQVPESSLGRQQGTVQGQEHSSEGKQQEVGRTEEGQRKVVE